MHIVQFVFPVKDLLIRFFYLFFSLFPLCLLTFCICQSSSTLLKHFFFIFIHIYRIWSAWFCLWIRIDFTRSQISWVIGICVLFTLSTVKKSLVCLYTLISCPSTYKWSNRIPLRRKYLNQMKQFLLLFSRPLSFFD